MKMKIRKALLLCMVMSMTMMLLTGCKQETPVTAESLITNMKEKEYSSCDVDMVMDMKMSASMDYGEMGSLSMDTDVRMEVNMKCDIDTSAMIGEMEMSMMGFSYSVPMETYMQMNEDNIIEYSQVAEGGDWYYSITENEEYEDLLENVEMLNGIDLSVLQNLTLTEPTEEEPDYVVTATLAFKDMADVMGADITELIESLGTEGEDLDAFYESLVYDVTYVFDAETQEVVSARVSLQTNNLTETSDVTITELVIACTYNQWNDVTVEIPAEVTENAQELKLTE